MKIFKIKNPIKLLVKLALICAGIGLYSVGLKLFVYSSNILPSGFTGLSILIQEVIEMNFNFVIPLTILNVAINTIPAIFSFKIIGKKFTTISFIILFAFTFVADIIPTKTITTDPLLSSIFGGILCGFGCACWLKCGVSGGGTDFVAMSLSAKYHIQTFNIIMGFNFVLIILQGILFGFEPALYSMVFQFIQTQALNMTYRHYEARTVFIITEHPDIVSQKIITETGHTSTKFEGIGSYTKKDKYMLYTVVTQPEIKRLINVVKKCDPTAFLNIMRSNEIQGNFKYLPVDIDDIDQNL